jgi:murein L,D-transpeptidase YafK
MKRRKQALMSLSSKTTQGRSVLMVRVPVSTKKKLALLKSKTGLSYAHLISYMIESYDSNTRKL